MFNYPVKILIDESGNHFVPYTSTVALHDPDGETIDDKIATKLEISSIIAGSGISLTPDTTDNTLQINCTLPGATLINNVTTSTSGQGALDAYQGYVLKGYIDAIPTVYNGTGTPSSNLGANGDLYIELSS